MLCVVQYFYILFKIKNNKQIEYKNNQITLLTRPIFVEASLSMFNINCLSIFIYILIDPHNIH